MNQPASTNLFKELFFRSLFQCNVTHPKNTTSARSYVVNNSDAIIEYKFNNYGYRGEDFKGPAKIVTLGCSQTYGEALPQNYIWPEVFSNITGKKVHNLASPGDSVQGQVFKAFKYFEEIGNPRVILGLFPSLRIELPTIKNVFEDSSRSKHKFFSEKNRIQTIFLDVAKEPVKYSKIPHNPADVIPKEIVMFYNFTFIKMLEQYCKEKDIIFIWGFWDRPEFMDYVKENAKETLTNYIDFDEIIFKIQVECISKEPIDIYKENSIGLNLTCHQDNKDIFNHPLYVHAADCNYETKAAGHFGIHTNLHVAEMFYKEYLKRKKGIK